MYYLLARSAVQRQKQLLTTPIALAGGDLGAAWFWPGEKRVASLAKQLGVPTFKQHVAGVALVDTGTARPQSYGDWEDQAGDSFRFEGGAQILALRLAERLPPFAELRLGMAVASVSLEPGAAPDAGAITVTAVPTGSEAAAPAVSFRCTGAVVVALPPALCAATVAFEPALPAPLAELARRTPSWFARMAKTLIRYESPFWRKRGLAGVGFSRAGPLSEIHDHSGPGGSPAMLFGFSQGPQEPDRAAVVAQLVRLFGPEAAEPLSVVTHSWSKERFTFGPDGGSGVGPEGRGDMHSTYGHPAFGQGAWGGRVLFTSTETGGSSPGHIEGALDAAERTVGAVLSGVAAAAKAK